MSDIAVKIENLSKQYRLGVVGTKTLRGDLQRFRWNLRGKGDPTLKIGQENKLIPLKEITIISKKRKFFLYLRNKYIKKIDDYGKNIIKL